MPACGSDSRNPDRPAAPWIVVTGLDGSGKTTLVAQLSESLHARRFRLPYHDFVKPALERSGYGQPHADVLTDRLLFALDARLANYPIREWRREGQTLVSQRGWMDNYIFGAVQGVRWEETTALLEPSELERPTAAIYLVADPDVAFERIRGSESRDKYETPEFMRIQHGETRRFFDAVEGSDSRLAPFGGIPSLWLDTTHAAPCAVWNVASAWLRTIGIAIS